MIPKAQVKPLDWLQFDVAVSAITKRFEGEVQAGSIDSVYGVPRGGLPLAVSLSHSLKVPLTHTTARPSTLVVDDVYETGATLSGFINRHPCAVWATKAGIVPGVFSALNLPSDEWLIFPWELEGQAGIDASEYYAKQERDGE